MDGIIKILQLYMKYAANACCICATCSAFNNKTRPEPGVFLVLHLMTQAPQATFKTGVSQTRDSQQAPPRSEAVVPLP